MSAISRASLASAIAQAKNATADIRVSVTRVTRVFDGRGKVTSSTTTTPSCIVTSSSAIIKQADGQEVQSKHSLLILERIDVKETDVFTLPGGETGPVVQINGLEDSLAGGGRYFTEVLLG